uniref:non-specific serine/threonine protein kinase n=1 Tax=Aceria tosichella TaxID=561515 RepID=A0A6G1SII1_9ACAR
MMMKKRTARDFKFIRLLGEGSFSSVYLAVGADVPPVVALTAKPAQDGDNSININHDDDQHRLDGRVTAKCTLLDDKSKVIKHESNDTTNATSITTTTKSTTPKRVRKYAIKVCQKSHIKRQGKQIAIMREKEILNILNQSPCKHFIRLYCTFQDVERLFFVMSYAENGELLTYMLEHPLSLDTVRKFTLQLVSALEHLHKLHIVHRDLKPENILLSELLDLLISDFGSAQIYNRTPITPITTPTPAEPRSSNSTTPLTTTTTDATPPSSAVAPTSTNATNQNTRSANATTSDRRNSFVGTAQYVSPEMLKNREASNKSDLWALGVIIYQMITNVMPFDAPNEYLIYKKIQSLDYSYPDNFDESARDLVDSFIKLDPKERLGANDDLQTGGYQSIRKHRFLSNIDSEHIMTAPVVIDQDRSWDDIIRDDPDLRNIDKITPGLDESQILRLLTDG